MQLLFGSELYSVIRYVILYIEILKKFCDLNLHYSYLVFIVEKLFIFLCIVFDSAFFFLLEAHMHEE
jgi:hypothetical protein